MHAHRNNPTQQQNTANTMIAIVPITKFIFSIPLPLIFNRKHDPFPQRNRIIVMLHI